MAKPTLFDAAAKRWAPLSAPLAERMRPAELHEIVGQDHLLAPNAPLGRALSNDRLVSIVLWGNPGCGKTTLAHALAKHSKAHFESFSAVLGGVAQLRVLLKAARDRRRFEGKRTLLFIDEIHRFNKGQQDALLPYVEQGDVILVGATTENPSFALNNALLSRSQVLSLNPLQPPQIEALLKKALTDRERGLGKLELSAEDGLLAWLSHYADGDARRALTALEVLANHAPAQGAQLTKQAASEVLGKRALRYDQGGEEHYNIASALIKSLRGSDPDAALYWMFRMLESGEDPRFVSRRLVIFASEDIGNADPKALEVAVAADLALQRLGLPEGEYPLSQCCLYLACAPKSDGVKSAMSRAKRLVQQSGSLPVPLHLCNAPTKLMEQSGYGQGYRYPHDFPHHYVPGESYLPEQIAGQRIYEPPAQGFEQKLASRLAFWRSLDEQAGGGDHE